jgi:NAD-dependent DNA ligase
MIPASNRQLKALRFFGLPVENAISTEAARREIARLLEREQDKLRWDKYVYLTRDFDSSSAELKDFDPEALSRVVLPEDWTATKAEREYREEMAARILETRAVYDEPRMPMIFKDHVFLFTGKFTLGTRELCERIVRERGGLVPESDYILHTIDYLVVGNEGSQRWKRGTYGSKIEAAVVERQIHGKPTIVTEEHWKSNL